MVYTVAITSQGQMTIPADVRRLLKLGIGKKAQVEVEDNKIIITPEPDILSFKGIFKTKKKIPFKVAREAFEEALARGEA